MLLSLSAYHFVDLNEALVGLIRVILLRKHQVKIFFFLFLAVLLICPMVLVDMFIYELILMPVLRFSLGFMCV